MRKGWEYKKLGEVATFINGDRGKNYPSAKDFVESGVPFINAGHLNNGIISYDKMNYITINKYNSLGSGKIIKNDILFCLRGSLGKYAIVAEDSMGAIASSLVIIRPFQNADNRFIAHFLSSAKIKEYIAKNNNGSSQPNLSAKSVASFIIPLPTLSTQLAIVSELDKINELIRLKKEQLKDFDNLAQSLFFEMFGDPVENEKGWEVKKLGEICEVVTGTTPKTNIPEYWGKGHYWVTPAELNDTAVYIDRTEREITEEALGKTKLRLLPVGTVLLSSRAPIGKVAITKVEMYCNQGFKNCICSDSICNKYLFYFLRMMKEYLNSLGRGATFKEISKSIVESIRIPLPPLSLQQLFAQRIEQIEREKSEVQKSIQNLETLLASRMQYWFE